MLGNFKLILYYSFEFEDGELTLNSEFNATAIVSAQVEDDRVLLVLI